MYYLRYEDRHKVRVLSGNVDPVKDAEFLRFRLPFPEEDNVQIGEYEPFKGQRLYMAVKSQTTRPDYYEDYKFPEDQQPGRIQLTHPCGLLVNVPCHHGSKLPDVGACKAFWNGKGYFAELKSLRPADGRVWPVVGCRYCGEQWRMDWGEIWDYIPEPLRARLEIYTAQFKPSEVA